MICTTKDHSASHALWAPEMAAQGGVQTYMWRLWEMMHSGAGGGGTSPKGLSLMDSTKALVGWPNPTIPRPHGANGSKLGFTLQALTRAGASHVIVGHVNQASVALIAKRLGLIREYVVVLHGIEAWRRLGWLKRAALRQAAAVVATTEFTARTCIEINGLSPANFKVIPLCSEPHPAEPERDFRLAGAWPILFVGRLAHTERGKGLETVLGAVAALRREGLALNLHVIGDGDDRPQLEALAAAIMPDPESVQFHGRVPDSVLQAAYRTAKAFVMPSIKEGFGIVFLEAMRHAVPCIGGAHGGTPEVFDDGREGLLVRYGDVDALSNHLRALIKSPETAHRLGAAGQARFHRDYTFNSFARRWRAAMELPQVESESARPQSNTSVVKRWAILGSQYVGAQLGIRALSMVGALMLVNLLPVREYGIYTLLLANLTFLNGVSDCGATASLFYFWRRAKRHLNIFHAYFDAVMRLRRALFVMSAIVSLAYLATIISLKQYESATLFFGSALMLMASWLLSRVGTSLAVLRIQGRFVSSYAVEAAGEATKLLAVGLLWLASMRFATAAMATMLAGSLASACVLGWVLPRNWDLERPAASKRASDLLSRAVQRQVLPTAPWTLFFVAQGPLVAWLAAAFGSSQNLGEIGALGRLSSIIALVSGFTVGVLVPRLSNVHDERKYLAYYLGWWGVLLGFGASLLLTICAWPGLVLWMIGHQYKELGTELLVSLLTAVVMTFEWYAGSINRARGWMGGQFRRIALIIAGQLAMLPFLDFNSTLQLLLFSLGTAVLTFGVQLTYNVIGFCEIRQARRT